MTNITRFDERKDIDPVNVGMIIPAVVWDKVFMGISATDIFYDLLCNFWCVMYSSTVIPGMFLRERCYVLSLSVSSRSSFLFKV